MIVKKIVGGEMYSSGFYIKTANSEREHQGTYYFNIENKDYLIFLRDLFEFVSVTREHKTAIFKFLWELSQGTVSKSTLANYKNKIAALRLSEIQTEWLNYMTNNMDLVRTQFRFVPQPKGFYWGCFTIFI